MLNQLSIRNFAIIDDITVSFENGLTVLTGETGAGKSIIIDAMQLLTGARASVDFVRHGAEKAEIIGMFDIVYHEKKIHELCLAYDIEYDENELFILERTITHTGKSVCRVNGKIVTLSILRSFGQLLVHIHSQHDHVHLMDSRTHIQLLDAYQTKKINLLLNEYKKAYTIYDEYRKEFENLHQDEQQLAHRLDLLLFQQQEIKAAQLEKDEDVTLEKERMQLQNYATIYDAISTSYEALNGDAKALELIDVASKAFADSKLANTEWKNYATKLESIYFQLEEITFDIRHAQDDLFFDENRLNEIESRLNMISHLKRKYGSDVNDIIAYEQKIADEIDTIENREAHHEQLTIKLNEAKKSATQAAEKLSHARKIAAKKLTKQIQLELRDLYLLDTIFDVSFTEREDEKLTENGMDIVQFLLATNKGEPLKELHKVASGGEISRIMLALKKIFAKHDQIGTVVFDEIDTGVSGRVAQAIAEKMYEIAKTNQVLCITHLAQVAAMSDHHLLIKKLEKKQRTTTSVHALAQKEKVEEIGKMITGSELTQTAIEHANQLLQTMGQFKKAE